LQTNGTIFNRQTQILAYADDIDIIGRSQAAVREAYLALEREANKVGLKINESTTKYMIAAGTDRMIRDVGHSVVLGDKTFEVVKEFVYLDNFFPFFRCPHIKCIKFLSKLIGKFGERKVTMTPKSAFTFLVYPIRT
jgi:hypothetical protein